MRRFASQYLDFFRLPDVATLMGVALLSRMPIGMVGLAMLMFLREALGSYALAGTVSGAYFVAMAVGAPIQGRLIDRSGPKLVLAVTASCTRSRSSRSSSPRARARLSRRVGPLRWPASSPCRSRCSRAPLAPPLRARGGPPPRLLGRRGADRGELHAGPRDHALVFAFAGATAAFALAIAVTVAALLIFVASPALDHFHPEKHGDRTCWPAHGAAPAPRLRRDLRPHHELRIPRGGLPGLRHGARRACAGGLFLSVNSLAAPPAARSSAASPCARRSSGSSPSPPAS